MASECWVEAPSSGAIKAWKNKLHTANKGLKSEGIVNGIGGYFLTLEGHGIGIVHAANKTLSTRGTA